MAVNDCETVIVTRKNDENVVIMSEAEYNNLMENMYLRRSAENHRLLLEAMQDDTASVSRTLEELDALADG
jgi:antitoxin YefM